MHNPVIKKKENYLFMYRVACRRVLSSAPLQLIGSSFLVAFGNTTYKLNLKNQNYEYNITDHLVDRRPQFDKHYYLSYLRVTSQETLDFSKEAQPIIAVWGSDKLFL
jgi:hypothetical protein